MKLKDHSLSPKLCRSAFQRITSEELTEKFTSTITTQIECKLLHL